MNILLVEDEDPKRERVAALLQNMSEDISIQIARSVRAAINQIKNNVPDMILLDMSLPTFDVSTEEAGGRPQNFGGNEVLRYMDHLEIRIPTIILTGYEAFISDDEIGLDLPAMDKKLMDNHPQNYKGLIYYNSLYEGWEKKLTCLIEKIVQTNLGDSK